MEGEALATDESPVHNTAGMAFPTPPTVMAVRRVATSHDRLVTHNGGGRGNHDEGQG